MAAPTALRASEVVKTYGKGESLFTALGGVSIDIRSGESVAIIGKSGSGKSMTALSLLGLLPQGAVTRGRARFDGVALAAVRIAMSAVTGE